MNDFRIRIMRACGLALRFYTHHSPFKRGRGAFIRVIEFLKRRGWPPPLIEIGEGLVMEFEPSLLGWTLFETGEWEPRQTSEFLSLIRSGDVVVDIGANTGYYALLAAAKIGRQGRVHAFEIQPAMIDVLRRNIVRNELGEIVTVVEAGCFSKAGPAVIEPHGDPGSARIGFAAAGIHVPLVTLDEYVASAALDRVDVLLIDTEGADFEILKGASQVLAAHHPSVITEVHHLEAFGGSEGELRTFMAQFGYTARELQGEFSRDLLFQIEGSAPARQ
ncbi:MAG: FkbM family methyltransferase [Thermoanaerobaculia bacterium]